MAATTQTVAPPLRISVDDLKRRLDAWESATLLDARTPDAWKSSDVKMQGAVRVDGPQVHADPSWPKDRLTVAYCT